ncbi:MAG: polysaccharide biosynthesis/export family protein [Bacteroidia bacterium]
MRDRIEGKFLLVVPIVALVLLALGGCVPYKKQVYFQYLEEMAQAEDGSLAEFEQVRAEYKLQNDDIIDIKITSPNLEAAAFFSQSFSVSGSNQQQMMQGAQVGDIYYLTGYIINDSGNVELPILGEIPASGKSLQEVKSFLEQELLKYFTSKNSFYVKVKLGGIRYSIHGEVARPGRYVVLESRYNIYQALAQVGDLTAFANRSEVWLLRQEAGKTKIYGIDLLSKEIMESPLFYIQPNDVVFVKPLKVKQYGVGSTFLQNFNSTVSVISATISLYLSYRLLTQPSEQ